MVVTPLCLDLGPLVGIFGDWCQRVLYIEAVLLLPWICLCNLQLASTLLQELQMLLASGLEALHRKSGALGHLGAGLSSMTVFFF